MNLLAIDPGPVVGWCRFENNVVTEMGQDPLDIWPKKLELHAIGLHVIVFEDYRIFGHKAKAHIGKKIETVRCIGVIESFAARHNIRVESQPASILPIAQLHSGVELPDDHAISHQYSALNHGYEWLVRNNGMPTALDLEEQRGKKD